MNKLEIKTEYLAERCEICHKNDCFNPVDNICTRCINLTNEIDLVRKPKTYLSIVVSHKISVIWMILTLFIIAYEVVKNLKMSYYVAIIPILYWAISTIVSLRDYRKLINEINNKINNENDLICVKSFINKNMRYALFLGIFYIVFPVFLIIFDTNMLGLGIFFTYIIAILPFLPFLKQLERNIEKIEVNEKNIELRKQLAYFIKKWHELGFKLPDK